MNTNALRQKILDLAIRGKLVPQDPNDEPESQDTALRIFSTLNDRGKPLSDTGYTRMAKSGMDMKVVQYLMGHAYMDVTMDVYNHITEQSHIETELAKLNSVVL